jgi:solute carrier family 9 (sodium/hydrogen exchanger), member 6/7
VALPAEGGESADSGTMILKLFKNLSLIISGSIFFGLCFGLLCAFITRRLRLLPPHARPSGATELSLLLVFSLMTFTLTERAFLSGILALFFCGITMRHYAYYNLSKTAKDVRDCHIKSVLD